MDHQPLEDEFNRDAPLRVPLDGLGPDAATPPNHDTIVMQAARAAAKSIRQRSSRPIQWRAPLALAASFVAGITLTFIYYSAQSPHLSQFSGLVVPTTAELRGAPISPTIPVEKTPAEAWYRYIQELVYAGDTELAAKHLQRFVELHPDFVYRP
jgi:hypothetical protein